MNLRVRNDTPLNIWASFTDIAISMLLILIFFILLQFIANSDAWVRMRLEKRQTIIQTAFEAEFQKEIAMNEIRIDIDGNLQRFSFSNHILFDVGEAVLKPQGRLILEKVGQILDRHRFIDENGKLREAYKRIHIEGHTDNMPINRPEFPSNWHLSAARSIAVVRLFQNEQVSLQPELLSATGYGEFQPVAPNDTDALRARNRRIEIVLAYTEKE